MPLEQRLRRRAHPGGDFAGRQDLADDDKIFRDADFFFDHRVVAEPVGGGFFARDAGDDGGGQAARLFAAAFGFDSFEQVARDALVGGRVFGELAAKRLVARTDVGIAQFAGEGLRIAQAPFFYVHRDFVGLDFERAALRLANHSPHHEIFARFRQARQIAVVKSRALGGDPNRIAKPRLKMSENKMGGAKRRSPKRARRASHLAVKRREREKRFDVFVGVDRFFLHHLDGAAVKLAFAREAAAGVVVGAQKRKHAAGAAADFGLRRAPAGVDGFGIVGFRQQIIFD